MKKNSTKAFNNTQDALRVLGCKRKDYHEGEKNVWYVEMPEFVRHESVKKEVVKENVNTYCAITMEPDEVLDLLEKIEKFIQDV